MKTGFKSILLAALALLFWKCNTLVNVQTIDLEVFVPARVVFPARYKTIAIRYNNSNVAYNPTFAEYIEDTTVFLDTTNIDSTASFIYYNNFKKIIEDQQFFDDVKEIKKGDYTNITFTYPWKSSEIKSDTADSLYQISNSAEYLARLLQQYSARKKESKKKIEIDSKYGLYSKSELKMIADSCQCDLLLSLDHFAVLDSKHYNELWNRGESINYILAFWNFYDLHNMELKYFYNRVDSISWYMEGNNKDAVLDLLPKRKNAIREAASISGINFAKFLVPHWIEVERIYYQSGNIQLKEAEKLMQKGKWLEAAKIWKNNIDNKNEKIAAKSMFNLALACEMEGKYDAAIDWAVKSYQLLGSKNELHKLHCTNYIQILSLRKRDIKNIERQLNPVQNEVLKK